MRKRFVGLKLVSVLLIFILAACSASQSEPNGESKSPESGDPISLVLALTVDPDGLHPILDSGDNTIIISNAIYDNLVAYNERLEVVPRLAKSWEIEDGGKRFVFKLDESITWHDGKPFTSADVKFSLDLVRTEGVMKSNLATVTQVDTPDPSTVVVTLSQPSGGFLDTLANYGTKIMPKHIFEGLTAANRSEQDPVGTGPYKFVEWTKAQTVTLAANPTHWRGKPNIDRLIFRIIPQAQSALAALQAGEVHALAAGSEPAFRDIPIVAKDQRFNVMTYGQITYWRLLFNTQVKPWDDVRVRQAVAHAIDKAKIVTGAYAGVPKPAANASPLTPSMWAFDPSVKDYPYDPAKAEGLLDQAGLTKDGSGLRLKVTLDYPVIHAGDQDMWLLVKEMLQPVGIQVELNQLETGAWLQKVLTERNFQLAFVGGSVGPDPNNLRTWYHSTGVNPGGYANPEVDRLLDEGAKAVDQAERKRIYQQVQALVAADEPSIPLFPLVLNDVWSKEFTGRDPVYIAYQDWSKIKYVGK